MSNLIEAIVDEITYTNSAFATSVSTGEVIFVNSRIVGAVGLKRGDVRHFTVVPNYPDKKDQVQWRAMRVELEGEVPTEVSPSTRTRVKNVIDLAQVALTAEQVSQELKIDLGPVESSLRSLVSFGDISSATVQHKDEMITYYCDSFDWIAEIEID